MGGEIDPQEYFSDEILDMARANTFIDYPTTEHDPAEIAFKEYENERWEEDPKRWSPLLSGEQLAQRPNPELEWFVPDWIPVGAKTIISAEPKHGKTILLFHLIRAAVEGGKFLGKQCPPTRVLYLSEITEFELKKQLMEVPGLLGNKNFYVQLPEETPTSVRTWEDTIEYADRMLETIKAKILVIDTFGSLAKLPPGGENDSATIQNTINKLNNLFKNRYLSVVLTHHNRKKPEDKRAGGTNLSVASARGSSAFVGGGGHVILMDAPDPEGPVRNFLFCGRYINGVKRSLTLTKHGYEEVQGFGSFGGPRNNNA